MKRLCGFAILAAALCACGSTYVPSARVTPSQGSSALASATPVAPPISSPVSAPPAPASPSIDCSRTRAAPTFAPAAPSARSLALVSTDGYGTNFVVRDVSDLNHPFTVSDLTHKVGPLAKFVDGAEVSYRDDATGLVRMPVSGPPAAAVAACGTQTFAWSPDGTAVAYVAATANPKVQALHLVAQGLDQVADTMPAFDGVVGCETRGQGCWETWQLSILYSQNGAYISYLEQLGAFSVFRIWSSSGKLLKSVDGTTATMQIWAGSTLYWQDDRGIESWRDGVEALALPGVRWIRPYGSPTGGQIVYSTLDAAYIAHVQLLDLQTLRTREIASSRSGPLFLSSRYLWYAGDTCSAPCYTPERSGQYVYDLQTGTESPSIITFVWDVWPHAA